MLNLICDQGLIDRLSERSRWPKRASPYPAVLFQRNLRFVVSAMRIDWHSFVGEVHTSYPGFKDCGEQRSPISPASSRRACHSRERSLLCRCGLLCTLFLSKQSAPGVRWSCKVDVSGEIQQTRFIQKLSSRRDPFQTRFIQKLSKKPSKRDSSRNCPADEIHSTRDSSRFSSVHSKLHPVKQRNRCHMLETFPVKVSRTCNIVNFHAD